MKIIRNSDLIKLILNMKKKLWIYLPAVVIDNLIMVFCSNIIPALFMKDFLNLISEKELNRLYKTLVVICILFVFGCILQPIFRYVSKKCVKEYMADLRLETYKHLTKLPIEYFEIKHRGDVISRLTNDTDVIEGLFSDQISNLIFTFCMGFGSLVFMLALEWRISLILVSIGIIYTFFNIKMSKLIRSKNDRIREQMGKLTGNIIDILSNTKISRMLQIENIIFNLFVKENNELRARWIKYNYVNTLVAGTSDFLILLRSIGTILLSVFLIMKGYINVGTAAAIFYLQENLFFMFKNIGNYAVQIQGTLSGCRRVLDFMEEPTEIEITDDNISDTSSEIMIEMKEVEFSYNAEKKCLNGLNFSVLKGQIAAFVGSSGCGKSTIMKLLLGFYKSDKGSILLDGNLIENYSLTHLREIISYVPQDPVLFNGTIFDNIKYGLFDATYSEVEAAAKHASILDFIISLPDGFNSLVGEKGNNLSVGQRQRIIIARALLKNASVILLDEPTSSLDTESEQSINFVLNKLQKKCTIIIATHRLYTIKNADIIYCMDSGRVVESGTHNTLLENGGVYNKLCSLQNF